jgi:folate-binding protein YgfZ
VSSPVLSQPGAVEADGPDTGVAAHYGDPYAEQRALALSWGVVDRSHRPVLRISGPDRLGWLHSLTTQQLERFTPGDSAQALVLSPQGHVEHHLTLTDDGTATWLHVEPGTAASLLDFLATMKFMLRVEVADVTAEFAVLTVKGPARPAPEGATAAAQITVGDEVDLILPRSGLAEAVSAAREAGAGLAGMWAYEALRIAAGRPRFGLDTDHRTIPHEVGWIGTAVQLDKGCYRGQETVARVHNIGHPPRRLVLLHLDGSADRLPAHDGPVLSGETAVGFVGSAGRHYELGPIALALVKRTLPVDETLTAQGIAASQEVIVPPDAGANVQITLRRPRGDLIGRPRE